MKLQVYQGTAESLRTLTQTLAFADSPDLPYFQVFAHQGYVDLPAPLPARKLVFVDGGERHPQIEANPRGENAGVRGTRPNNRCAAIRQFAQVDQLEVQLFALEERTDLSYTFLPRNVAPEFR